MAKKVTAATFAAAVGDILKEYAEEKNKDVREVVKAVAKKGALAVKNEALQDFPQQTKLQNGRYGTGWTYTIEEKRLWTEATIYNSKYPGLPHLLEHGHATRGGGRTGEFVHIAPVEDEVERSVNAMLRSKL